MSTVFEGKVRKVGNSMAVIIPRDVLEETGAREGDIVKLSVPMPKQKRKAAIKRIAGVDSKSKPFTREKSDRF
jgi:antitoxin component of MazEF toxin-antitoxin module